MPSNFSKKIIEQKLICLEFLIACETSLTKLADNIKNITGDYWCSLFYIVMYLNIYFVGQEIRLK